MSDPYKVLGVSFNASDDLIKQAYRELARKYHPDNYVNNPLSDLATEKMKEINSAYDDICEQRSNQGTSPYGQNSGRYNTASDNGTYSNGNNSSQFADIRRMLQNGMVTQALELLEGVPVSSRDAEWYFLKGTIFYNRGWLDEALKHFQNAVQLDPSNPEYQKVLNQIIYQRQQGFNNGSTVFSTPSSCCVPCSLCSTLICADCTFSACRCCF